MWLNFPIELSVSSIIGRMSHQEHSGTSSAEVLHPILTGFQDFMLLNSLPPEP